MYFPAFMPTYTVFKNKKKIIYRLFCSALSQCLDSDDYKLLFTKKHFTLQPIATNLDPTSYLLLYKDHT